MDSICQTELRLKGVDGDQGMYEVREAEMFCCIV
jgi:hypothetical protein